MLLIRIQFGLQLFSNSNAPSISHCLQKESLKKMNVKTGEMPALESSTALPEDISSVPRPQDRKLTTASEILMPFFWLPWVLHTHACVCICIHTNKKVKINP